MLALVQQKTTSVQHSSRDFGAITAMDPSFIPELAQNEMLLPDQVSGCFLFKSTTSQG
jgi:hypothetical protein